jgi:uncharacterized protein
MPKMTLIGAIDLDITQACNNACTYCFKHLDMADAHHMSVETAKDAIDWLIRVSQAATGISVNFMGGEPILQFPAMKEIVKWGRRRGKSLGKTISFSFTTNLSLFNDEIRRWVDENGLGVLMSIDGIPEVQDDQRPSKSGKSQAHIVEKWARSMLQTRPQSDARMTLTPKWVHRLSDSCRYLWDDVGFDNITMAFADYPRWEPRHFQVYAEQLEVIEQKMIDAFREEKRKRLALLTYFIHKVILPMDTGVPVATRHFPCGAGYNYAMIDYAGNIWPCHRFEGAAREIGRLDEVRMANIYSQDFNEKLSNAFCSIDHSRTAGAECKECPVFPICGGGCPAANFSEGRGDMYRLHPAVCQLMQISYRYAERIYRAMKEIDFERCRKFMAMETGATRT